MKITLSVPQLVAYSAIFLIVVIIDRATKIFALNHLQTRVEATPFLSGELVFNQGISWGLFNSHDGSNFLWVSALVVLVTFVLGYYTYNRLQQGYSMYGEILVLAGAISNMADRILYNGVVDFISVHYNTYQFPYFNIADSCIVLGVFIMFLQMVHE